MIPPVDRLGISRPLSLLHEHHDFPHRLAEQPAVSQPTSQMPPPEHEDEEHPTEPGSHFCSAHQGRPFNHHDGPEFETVSTGRRFARLPDEDTADRRRFDDLEVFRPLALMVRAAPLRAHALC